MSKIQLEKYFAYRMRPKFKRSALRLSFDSEQGSGYITLELHDDGTAHLNNECRDKEFCKAVFNAFIDEIFNQ